MVPNPWNPKSNPHQVYLKHFKTYRDAYSHFHIGFKTMKHFWKHEGYFYKGCFHKALRCLMIEQLEVTKRERHGTRVHKDILNQNLTLVPI